MYLLPFLIIRCLTKIKIVENPEEKRDMEDAGPIGTPWYYEKK